MLGSISRFYDDTNDIKLTVHETLHDFSKRRSLTGWVPGDQVEDTKPLHAEITRLKNQVSNLTQELENTKIKEISPDNEVSDSAKNRAICNVIRNTKVTIPGNISSANEDTERDLFTLLIVNRDLYVRGVLIGLSSSEKSKWFSKNVYPRYVTHKIMQMERKTPHSTFYSITQSGLELLAWYDHFVQKNFKSIST